jgi:type I restriction-modification system DNA methylase subunit
MTLSFNEIRLKASNFVKEWEGKKNTARERGDAYDFMTDFFEVFGVPRKKVSILESRVNMSQEKDELGDKTKNGRKGYMDLFWEGYIIIEMKSPGKNKTDAYKQALEYANNIPIEKLPKIILISDFISFDYYDLEKNGDKESFLLEELPQKIELFSFLAGYKDIKYKSSNPVDIIAAEHMGELHDALKENGYTGHYLEMYLVRLLFCLFADDSGIFDEKDIFLKYINDKTNPDGSDLALHLGLIFEMLDKPVEERQKNRDEIFNKFPYVNGGLFEERLPTAAFNSNMRKTLLKCCLLDWSQIKPEIFGAMFQSVKDKEKRRILGEHYTSEENILKLIKPLFLDDLWEEFNKIKSIKSAAKKQKLLEFHAKLQRIKILDPACGCGNFLVVSYRELRLLEIEVIDEWLEGQKILDIDLMVRVNVDQFYGIEIEEFPAQIAKTALWLMDHLMNNIASKRLNKYIARIPLTATPNIVIGNALTIDWESVIPKNELSYILGNPPFIGSRIMNKQQKAEVENTFNGLKNFGDLDYVTCWYKKAAQYIQGTEIEVAFVSTNSICQGLQVPILWSELMNKHGIKINFAHQTFKWRNEARGKAADY